MKKIILLFIFVASAAVVFGSNTEPNTDKPIPPVEQASIPADAPEKALQPCVYCGTCNGTVYCAGAATCGEAIDLFIQMCEGLGCC